MTVLFSLFMFNSPNEDLDIDECEPPPPPKLRGGITGTRIPKSVKVLRYIHSPTTPEMVRLQVTHAVCGIRIYTGNGVPP